MAATLAVTVGLGVALRRVRRVTPVADELRHRQLYVPFSPTMDTVRRITGRPTRTPADVPTAGLRWRAEFVPAAADRPRVRVLVHERVQRARPSGALLWVHGGGFVEGSPEQSVDICNRIADELDVLVVNVDYRLAPGHPFPAALDDCTAALQWISDCADELGISIDRIAVGGDSAGGALAACLAQLAHDRGGPAICFQLLKYPALDDRTSLRTDRRARAAIVWTRHANRAAWTAYLGHRPTPADQRPYIAAARRDDLSGLPPAWIGIGDIDLFHDEAVEYAQRLRSAGVPCELDVEPGMYHAADAMRPSAPSMLRFNDRLIAGLAASDVTDLHGSDVERSNPLSD